MLKLFLTKDTTRKKCYKCQHFSRSTRDLKYQKSFKLFRYKYWRFLLYKLNFWSEGYCNITVIADGEHVSLKMRGYESCLIEDVQDEIMDVKDFVGKLPDTPEEIADTIDDVERKRNQNERKISSSS